MVSQIVDNAPKGAVWWSPIVGQYFDNHFLSLAPANKGKFVQVDEQFRNELIRLSDLI